VLRGRGTNRLALATAFASAALAMPGTAFAQTGGLIDQYIEDVPTSGGTHHAGTGSGGTGSTGSSAAVTPASLPSDVKTKLEDKGGKDSDILQQIATSPRYGAPPATSEAIPATSSPDPFSAAIGALTDGGDGRMVGLFVALLAITAVSLGFAAARRRTI
jgi:hypothetical protein